MKCYECSFKRDLKLPYRSDDIICCHPDIARNNWVFAGKIITQDGQDPEWCPFLKYIEN